MINTRLRSGPDVAIYRIRLNADWLRLQPLEVGVGG